MITAILEEQLKLQKAIKKKMIEKQIIKLMLDKKIFIQSIKVKYLVMYFKVALVLCMIQYKKHTRSMMLI